MKNKAENKQETQEHIKLLKIETRKEKDLLMLLKSPFQIGKATA